MSRFLYLDCFSGISGDMAVGALCDLGVETARLEAELHKLSLGKTQFQFERQTRQGISGLKFSIQEDEELRAEEKAHMHTRYEQIRDLIGSSALSDFVRQKALAIFKRIAVAEAKIHGVAVETVRFHEVGAIDSIADIVGACVALEELGQPRVMVSPLREGRGWIDCAHGRFPLPAPATARDSARDHARTGRRAMGIDHADWRGNRAGVCGIVWRDAAYGDRTHRLWNWDAQSGSAPERPARRPGSRRGFFRQRIRIRHDYRDRNESSTIFLRIDRCGDGASARSSARSTSPSLQCR